MPSLVHSLLHNPTFSRIRRNHGLEHASIHMLARKKRKSAIAGHSDPGGFWLFGDLTTEEVEEAVNEALARLRAGERNLAIHPNCGTNFVTSGLLAGVAGAVSMAGVGPRSRDKLGRIPLAAMLATVALIAARPLGTRVQQRITTSGDPEGMEIVEIRPATRNGAKAHRITTRG